jgi:epoxyqueuosine reductase
MCAPGPYQEIEVYKQWINADYHGRMMYMMKSFSKRQDLRNVMPSVRTVIVAGLPYHTPYPFSVNARVKGHGWISRYAWGDDYHDVLGEKLANACRTLKAGVAPDASLIYYVDTGPILEKLYAHYSGVGWIGKNGCIINRKYGSWVFLGVLLTDLELPCDPPAKDYCGRCRSCLDICPTGAIIEPKIVNATRCISYLNIELREVVPEGFQSRMSMNLFGCDLCQDVCPWNRKAPPCAIAGFHPRVHSYNPKIDEIHDLDEINFKKWFQNSPIMRRKLNWFKYTAQILSL